MKKTQGNFPERLEKILENINLNEFARAIGYSIRMVQGLRRGEYEGNEKICQRIAENFGYNFHWLLTGKGEPYTELVAVGSLEEATRGAEDDEAGDLPLDYWKDRSWLERWISEENAILLYRITREELTMLAELPILEFKDHEESYAEFYRMCLLVHRKKRMGKPQRHKDTKQEIQKIAENQ